MCAPIKPILRQLVVHLVIGLSGTLAMAQSDLRQKWELGWWVGTCNYVGDIHTSKANLYKVLEPGVGGYIRSNFNPRMAARLSLSYGLIKAEDRYSGNPFMEARNLSFRSSIAEAALQLEFNFLPYVLGHEEYNFAPYLFAGIAGFAFIPKAMLNDQWHPLRPLGTEGQQFPDFTGNDPYDFFQVALPLGGGIKYNLNRNVSLGIEMGYRLTFTDYLDDISGQYVDPDILIAGQDGNLAWQLADRSWEQSGEPVFAEGHQRGNSRNRDAYIFTGVSLSYTFTELMCPWPSSAQFKY